MFGRAGSETNRSQVSLMYRRRVLRQGSGEPLVLLHGILCSERVWGGVVPLLAARDDVIAPTMLGHSGGAPVTVRPAIVRHLVDDVERLLDESGVKQAHLAGNSLGGWVALELARRGRALTVCALSPAGMWDGSTGSQRVEILLRAIRDARRSRAILPLVARSGMMRHWALRFSALHGERVTPAQFIGLADDVIACQIAEDLLVGDGQLAPLDPVPCPITIAWSAGDRILPLDVYRSRARELVPDATFSVLEDVGHVPMLDHPQLVAQTILATIADGSAA